MTDDDEIRADELAGVFSVPQWVRDLGLAAWLLVGITLLLVGIVWLLSLTAAIVMPVVTAAIMAAVLSPVVGLLQQRGLPRAAASALLLLLAIAAAVALTVLILTGIGSQADALRG